MGPTLYLIIYLHTLCLFLIPHIPPHSVISPTPLSFTFSPSSYPISHPIPISASLSPLLSLSSSPSPLYPIPSLSSLYPIPISHPVLIPSPSSLFLVPLLLSIHLRSIHVYHQLDVTIHIPAPHFINTN